MKIIIGLLLFISFNAKCQIFQEFDIDKMFLSFQVSKIVCDDLHHKYSFDYTFKIKNYDSTPVYIAVEDFLHDTIILSAFSPIYCLNRILNFYFGTCDESRGIWSCKLPDESLYLRKICCGEMLNVTRTVNTIKEVADALKKPQLDIHFNYLNLDSISGQDVNKRIVKKSYMDVQPKMKKVYLKINMQNYKVVKNN